MKNASMLKNIPIVVFISLQGERLYGAKSITFDNCAELIKRISILDSDQ